MTTKTISTKLLRENLGNILDEVSKGSEYVLTVRRKVVGKLVPVDTQKPFKKDLNEYLSSNEFKNRHIPENIKKMSDLEFKNIRNNRYGI